MSRRFLTAEDVRRAGGAEVVVDEDTVVTPQALDVARSMGVQIRTRSGGWTEPTPDRGPDAEREQVHPHPIPEPTDELMGTGVIVTAVGPNRPGVLAEITGVIGQHGASIRDISQKMVDPYFHLVLVCELADPSAFVHLKGGLEDLSGQKDYVVRCVHERVFRFMHRV
jgi:ACT domain-containing protein